MTYVMFVAFLNFALGMGLAFFLYRGRRGGSAMLVVSAASSAGSMSVSAEKRRRAKTESPERSRREGESVRKPAVLDEPVHVEPIAVPSDWREWLGDDEPFHDWIDAATATGHRIALDALQAMLPIDETLKRAEQAGGDAGFARVDQDLQQLVKSFRPRFASIAEGLAGRGSAETSPAATAFDKSLKTICQSFDELMPSEGAAGKSTASSENLQRQFHQLARALHTFRDELFPVANQRLASAGKACDLISRFREDKVLECETLVGLELVLSTWRDSDPAQARNLSFVLFDLDRIDQLNRELGLDAGDRHVTEAMKVLTRCVRRNRGFDRVFRVSGQQLLLFLGDTPTRNAVYAAERIRQTLAQTHFRWRNRVTEVRCSAALTPLQKDDSVDRIMERLDRTVRKAKRAGGDQSLMTIEGKTTPVESKLYPMPASTIDV